MINSEKLIISDVCEFIGGSQPPKTNFSNEFKDGFIRFVQTRDFKTDNFITFIPKHLTTKFFGKTDIMIGRYGPPIFQIFRGMEGAYNVALLKAKPKKNILNDYLYYFLQQKSIFEYVDKLSARTGGQTGVDLFSLNKYPINLPSADIQKKIAEVLSDLDAKIELNNKINVELEAMAKTLYNYWFVQFDFPDVNGKPYKTSGGKMVWNEDLKREIPENFEVRKIKKALKTVLGGTPSTAIEEYWNGNIPWLNSGEIANFPIVNSEASISQKALENSATSLMMKGTVVLSITRHIRPSILGIDACANQSVIGICESDKIQSSFIYPMIQNEVPRYMILRTGAQQPHINKQTIDDTLFVLPQDNILEKYYDKVISIYDKIINNAFQNQELSSLRDWLLPMLMNGQVTVDDSLHEKNVTEFLPKVLKAPEKAILAGHIINATITEDFGRVKFQKLLYLTENFCKLNLESNYIQKAAGPYDGNLISKIETDLKRLRFFEIKQENTQNQRVHYKPLNSAVELETLFDENFTEEKDSINNLLSKFKNSSWDRCEIVATLYAVWNNRILKNELITDELLKADFLDWDSQKIKYKDRLDKALDWMRKEGVVPSGFGNEIKRAKK